VKNGKDENTVLRNQNRALEANVAKLEDKKEEDKQTIETLEKKLEEKTNEVLKLINTYQQGIGQIGKKLVEKVKKLDN